MQASTTEFKAMTQFLSVCFCSRLRQRFFSWPLKEFMSLFDQWVCFPFKKKKCTSQISKSRRVKYLSLDMSSTCPSESVANLHMWEVFWLTYNTSAQFWSNSTSAFCLWRLYFNPLHLVLNYQLVYIKNIRSSIIMIHCYSLNKSLLLSLLLPE